jgi:conjugal transfer/type IV secretion protein DotA/TraY
MKLFSRLLAGITLACVSLSAFASDVTLDTIEGAATRSGDLSRQMLVMVFGDVVNNPINPASQSLIGELYGIFNGIICGLAFIWLMFITLRTTAKSGHRGKVFSSGFTALAPVTSMAGFMALVPTPSGWSMSNLVFLWMSSVMGVGSANLLTDTAADAVMQGKSLIVQPVSGQTVSAARSIFEMYLCQNAVNQERSTMYASGSSDTPAMTETMDSDGRGAKVTNGSAICGTARLPSVHEVESSKFMFGVPFDTQPIENAQMNAFNTLRQTLSNDAANFVQAYVSRQNGSTAALPDAETDIQNAASAYEDTVNQAIQGMSNSDTLQSQVSAQLKKYGWISLGAWYQTFATANTKGNDVAKIAPVATGPSSLGDLGTTALWTQVATVWQAQRQNSTWTPPMGTPETPDPEALANARSPDSALLSLSVGQGIAAGLAKWNIGSTGNDYSGQVNPLLKMKTVGDYTLSGAEGALATFTAAKTILALRNSQSVEGKVIAVANALTGAGDIASSVLDAISPVFYFLLLMLFSIGFSLSIFLPFIPFIYWLTACASWMASVLIGTTAGSLWAWTHIGGEEDKGSRAVYGYIYLVDAAIRPSLMVFGFFFSSLVIVAIGTLLNELIAPGIANVQSNSITGLTSVVGILMIYARLCTTLASTVFSLQVYMPDYIIAWLGGKEAAQLMNGAVDSAKNMFIGFGNGVGRTPRGKQLVAKEKGNNAENGFM